MISIRTFLISLLNNRWRNRLKFRKAKIKFGSNLSVLGNIYLKISPAANVVFGSHITITNGMGFNTLCGNINGAIQVSKGAKLFIDDYSGLSSPHIWAKESIFIGKHVDIGADCIIMDNDCHSLDSNIRADKSKNEDEEYYDYLHAKSAPIIIEDNVLIGTRCIILKGVTIGKRSIIGAGSVVANSIPPNSIAAGNPCKIIRNI